MQRALGGGLVVSGELARSNPVLDRPVLDRGVTARWTVNVVAGGPGLDTVMCPGATMWSACHRTRTAMACGPLWPSVISNSTARLSASPLKS